MTSERSDENAGAKPGPVMLILVDGRDARRLLRRGLICAQRARREVVLVWLAAGWLPNLRHPSATEAISRRLSLGVDDINQCERLVVVESSSDASIRKLMGRFRPSIVMLDPAMTEEDTIQRIIRHCDGDTFVVAVGDAEAAEGEARVHIYSSDRMRH